MEMQNYQNVLHFKYLGVMQSSDGDPLFAVNHPIVIAWSRYADLKRLLTAQDYQKGLCLRLLNASLISNLLYGCEAWKMSPQARRKLNGTVSKMLSRITGRTIAVEAR